MATLHVLLVEDDPMEVDIDLLQDCKAGDLAGPPYDNWELRHVTNQEEADRAVQDRQWDIVLLDLQYPLSAAAPLAEEAPDLQGMTWLPELREKQRRAAIVILTKFAEVPNVVAAIRDHDADEFVAKTESFPAIVLRIQNGWRHARERNRAATLRNEYRSVLRSMGSYAFASVIEGEITRTATRLALIAQEIKNGDPSAIADAPQSIRDASTRLCDKFNEAHHLIGDVREPLKEVDLIEELVEPLQALYERPIDTSAVADKSLRIWTFLDDLNVALHEVVQNAVDTEASSIRVEVEETQSGAVIHVHDNGGGFSEEAMERKFEAGFGTRKKGTTKHKGLGLYIAKRMIESIGGAIRVENEGQGAHVALTVASLSGGTVETV